MIDARTTCLELASLLEKVTTKAELDQILEEMEPVAGRHASGNLRAVICHMVEPHRSRLLALFHQKTTA